MWQKDHLPLLEPDGLATPDVGEWAYKKYLRVWMYDEMFATGMKNKGPRVYVDLFAGAGRARLRESEKIVPSSALLALQIKDPFDRYIFCERDLLLLDSLRQRVAYIAPAVQAHFIPGDVNGAVDQISQLIPTGALSFCFADPFGVNLRLETVRRLAQGRRMDFLILLALQMDAIRNQAHYGKQEIRRLDEFLGNTEWREEWRSAKKKGISFRSFLADQYARAMTTLGYLPTTINDMYEMRTEMRRLSIYYLAFFGKHPLAQKFWREVCKYTEPQTSLLDELGF
jgi:three-Cys-motif partner protein